MPSLIEDDALLVAPLLGSLANTLWVSGQRQPASDAAYSAWQSQRHARCESKTILLELPM